MIDRRYRGFGRGPKGCFAMSLILFGTQARSSAKTEPMGDGDARDL